MAVPFVPLKRFGQNFLQDPNIIRKIVSAVQAPSGAKVVEIGPGTGALTALLLELYPDMVAIEVDPRAVSWLSEQYPSLEVRQEDVLETGWEALASGYPLFVVGNLPYYITTPILFSLIDHAPMVKRAVLMMQYEVAQRLVAPPNSKAYGILSVATQLCARPEVLFKVPPSVFYPKPEVNSAVIALNFYSPSERQLPIPAAYLRQVIRTAFNQRRKTLRNSLHSLGQVPEKWAGLRAEDLMPNDFVNLAVALSLNT
ncbi:MAG: ribosomal RNA small subunit methyltransferase A [Bacteroidetes Order II. Incertae sedis bacterium]|nr:ribosomal RNA small subunit methyltransferase A [Bacteroidetes Order II. bacterium]